MRTSFFCVMLLFSVCFNFAIAQTEFFYYSGEQIPLSINNNKVCLSIPKTEQVIRDRIHAQVTIEKSIKDDKYDIFIVQQSDYNALTNSNSWEEDKKSILSTNCYTTPEQEIVYSTPYINVKLKTEHDLDLLQSYSESCGLEIITSVPLMPLWYILSVTSNTKKTPLECANYLWETGLFEESTPDFVNDDIEHSELPSSIKSLTNGHNDLQNKSDIYDLSGRKHKTISKDGIYIIDGRKFFKK